MTVVLKVESDTGIHRIQLDGDPTWACVTKALATLFPDAGYDAGNGFAGLALAVKYEDEEGDSCTLVQQTFPDFVETAKLTTGDRRVLKMRVDVLHVASSAACSSTETEDPSEEEKDDSTWETVQEDEEELESPDEVSVFSDDSWEMIEHLEESRCARREAELEILEDLQEEPSPIEDEIQAEIARIKAACETEVVRHLEEWLRELHEDPLQLRSYEHWIADLHPENVRTDAYGARVVDARMYLEGSFHRQVWNEMAAPLPGLSVVASSDRRLIPP